MNGITTKAIKNARNKLFSSILEVYEQTGEIMTLDEIRQFDEDDKEQFIQGNYYIGTWFLTDKDIYSVIGRVYCYINK